MRIERTESKRVWRAVLLITGAALYRPLVFWAENAWDLAKPEQAFLIPGVALALGIIMLGICISMGSRILPVGFTVAALILVLFHFHTLPWFHGGIWIVVVGALGVFAHRAISDQALDRLTTIALAVVILAPTLQVSIQHITHRHSYPLANVADAVPAKSSGAVEDVLVVIVDSYPMLAVAEQWFGHDPSPLKELLLEAEFTIERVSWSHNTFTGLAVPSILQLEQVADASPKGAWGNRRTSYDIIGGGSFVAGTLRQAGFQYIHVESGWNGGACREVDVCLKSFWLDEVAWNLLSPSFLAEMLDGHFGSMIAVNTMRAVEHLTTLEVFGDGRHDFVYAHLLLPHAPYVVDSGCDVIPSTERSQSDDVYEPLRQQLGCVDSLLEEILTKVTDSTAVLIAGDHGPGEGGQVGAASDTWRDADIAERLGALLAYRLPTGCDAPLHPTNVYAMRAIMECAVVAHLPTGEVGFLVGADGPKWIGPDRLASITDRLAEGSLNGFN